MKFGVNTYVWVSPCTTDAIRALAPKAKRMGFGCLEISVKDPTLIDFKETMRILYDNHLSGLVCGSFGKDRNICSPNPDIRAQAKAYISRLINAAEEINSNVISGPIYAAVGKEYLLNDQERQDEWNRSVEGIQEMADLAETAGVRLALEPLNRYKGNMINVVDQGLIFLEDVGRENVGLLLDTYHMHIEEKNSAEAIRRAGKHVFHFHASENDRGIPGSGQVHWQEIADALQEIGYSGAVVIESFTSTVASNIISCNIWRETDQDDDIAEKGLAFLQGLLRG